MYTHIYIERDSHVYTCAINSTHTRNTNSSRHDLESDDNEIDDANRNNTTTTTTTTTEYTADENDTHTMNSINHHNDTISHTQMYIERDIYV